MASTISISSEMKEKLKSFGRAGDSYEDVIKKMYDMARRQMIHDFLYDENSSIPIDDAIREAKNKWQK